MVAKTRYPRRAIASALVLPKHVLQPVMRTVLFIPESGFSSYQRLSRVISELAAGSFREAYSSRNRRRSRWRKYRERICELPSDSRDSRFPQLKIRSQTVRDRTERGRLAVPHDS